MARYLSCPAVSQICALTMSCSTTMLTVANSTPIVALLWALNSPRQNLLSKLVFPTPLSPIRTTCRRAAGSRLSAAGSWGAQEAQQMFHTFIRMS